MKLYESAVKKPISTILIFVGVAVMGLYSLSQLSVDLMPDIEVNTLTVVTTYPGASASDIETNVSRPLEDVLNSCENLKKITSTSRDNISLVTLEFNYGTNIDAAGNDVRDKMDMVKSSLPDEVGNPIIFKFSMDMIPVVIYSATAVESSDALYKILDEKIANPLNRVNGVGAVSISGAPQRQIDVSVSPERLESYNLTVEQIAGVIAQENLNVPAGSFDIGTQTYSLRVEGEFKESSELLNVVVASYGGQNVYLHDVATVSDTIKGRVQESYANGVKGAAIVVQKQSGSNTVEIAKKIKEIMPELQQSLPPDIIISEVMDTSEFIETSIDSLMETIILACLFVMVIVLFFLGRWRATFIVIIAIPISLVASFIYLMITGGTLNIISLSSLSIAIGLVVDDAIVILENVTTHIERGSSPKEAAIYGTNEVAVAVMASTLTIVAVFMPMTLAGGLAGVMFQQLGWMVSIMILVSLVVALTLTPVLCSQMLRLNPNQGKFFAKIYSPIQRFLDNLDEWYAKILGVAVRNRWKTVVFSLLLLVGIFVLSGIFLKTEFMPASDNNMISLDIHLNTGTRMEIAREKALEITQLIKDKYPEIEVTNATYGQADDNNLFAAVMQENATNLITFNLRTVKANKRNRSIFEISDELRADFANMPDLYKYKVTPGGSNMMMGGGSTVDVEIYGHSLEQTDRIASLMKQRFDRIDGFVDVLISRADYRSEYQVEFDRAKLAENGLNSATAASFIRNRINGLTLSKFREDGDEYDIVVRYGEEYRQSIEAIENIIVYNSQGNPLRIGQLGKVVEKASLPQIDRQNRQRVVKVQGSLSGRALSEVIGDVNTAIKEMNAAGDIPAEIGVQIAGSFEEQQETNSDLFLLMMLCVLLVYIVMAAQFESMTYPFIIMFSLPFGLAGVLLALMITGQPLSLMAMIGIVMLIGIVVKNGIVLIDYVNLNRERGMLIDKAVISGGKSRLRPVLMTSLTAVLGMIPMAIPRGQGSEMWQPMGTAIVGGLLLSTLLTLVLVPALYSIFGGVGVRNKRKKHRKIYS